MYFNWYKNKEENEAGVVFQVISIVVSNVPEGFGLVHRLIKDKLRVEYITEKL